MPQIENPDDLQSMQISPGFFCVHDDSHAGISKKSVFIYQN